MSMQIDITNQNLGVLLRLAAEGALHLPEQQRVIVQETARLNAIELQKLLDVLATEKTKKAEDDVA